MKSLTEKKHLRLLAEAVTLITCQVLSLIIGPPHFGWLVFLAIFLWLGMRIPQSNIADSATPTWLARQQWKIVLVLVIFSFALRLTGLNFGLPSGLHPDEGRKVRIAQRMIRSQDYNPHYFLHPSFTLYGMTFLGEAYKSITGQRLGKEGAPVKLRYLGRLLSCVLGSLSVALLFFLGKELFSAQIGLLAASLLAVLPLHVVCSRYVKEDASLVFFILLSLLTILIGQRRKNTAIYLLGCLFAGFAMSAKYTGVLSALFIVIPLAGLIYQALRAGNYAIFTQHFATVNLLIGSVACGTVALGFLLITPYALLDFEGFLQGFGAEQRHMTRGHNGAILPGDWFWMYHLQRSIFQGMTPLTMSIALLGCGFLLKRRNFQDLIVITAILLFYLPAEWVRAKPEPQPDRYILPCLPFLALAGAVVITNLSNLLQQQYPRLKLILVTLFVGSAALYSVPHTFSILEDTRIQAKHWIETNIAKQTLILVDANVYAPPIRRKNYPVISALGDSRFSILPTATALQDTGAKYLVVSSFFYDRFVKNPEKHSGLGKLYGWVFKNLQPVKVFSKPRYSYGFHNPTIRIYEIRPSASGISS
ncbi:glycosyltransferase family 39 protein [bacterium]|nr:glycosyltransferase family 39 protein [bacterium]